MARKKSNAKAEPEMQGGQAEGAEDRENAASDPAVANDAAAEAGGGVRAGQAPELPAGDAAAPAAAVPGDRADAAAQGAHVADGPEGPAWLDIEAGREQAMLAAALAANDLAGVDDAIFGELADYLDKHADAPIDVLANVVLKARGEAYRPVTLAADGDLWWPLTAFKAVYVELMAVARREAALLKGLLDMPRAPDPLAELKLRHDRIKRRERMARGTPYERRLRARRKAAAAELKAALAKMSR